MKVGIVGASGYAGVELLRLCAGHPDLDVTVATAGGHTGDAVAQHTPSLAAAYPSLSYAPTDAAALDGLDLVFLALPHGQSQHLVPQLTSRVGVVVDLAADFRLHDPTLYPTWYGEPHTAPELLGQFVYGLPELYREELRGARLIAAPGCYPTAAILALAPLLRAGVVAAHPAAGPTTSSTAGFDLMTGSEPGGSGFPEPSLIVDAASGVSGAGRSPKDELHFSAVDEDFIAYGLLDHRHTAEMEQSLEARVLFTPHLAPMVRGILATCYGRPTAPDGADGALTTESAMEILHHQYDDEPFVIVTDDPPSTKATSGSNCAHVTARVDGRTGWVLAIAAIDNLIKGASGQAVQCANLALGLPEGTGLPMAGVYP
jgi:N-acetyl-gamma-glutamyl-phosphate reductase